MTKEIIDKATPRTHIQSTYIYIRKSVNDRLKSTTQEPLRICTRKAPSHWLRARSTNCARAQFKTAQHEYCLCSASLSNGESCCWSLGLPFTRRTAHIFHHARRTLLDIWYVVYSWRLCAYVHQQAFDGKQTQRNVEASHCNGLCVVYADKRLLGAQSVTIWETCLGRCVWRWSTNAVIWLFAFLLVVQFGKLYFLGR